MPTTTTTYSFNKPVVGADEDDWGGYLNGNWDSVDDLLDGTTPVTGIDINSGTLDGVTIGGTTAGAGTFTTLTANTSITGTLATAAQPNITSVGSLTSLDVGGTVTADGLTVETLSEGTAPSNTPSDYDLAMPAANTDGYYGHNIGFYSGTTPTVRASINSRDDGSSGAVGLTFYTGSGTTTDERLRISSGGDISFYEDTGTTAKFFWDASAESLGIGTSSPSQKLHLGGTAPLDSIIRQDSTVSGTNWEIGERAAGKWQIWEDDTDTVVATFQSNGNVGIGTSSPSSFNTTGGKLVVASGAGNVAALFSDAAYYTLGVKHTGVGTEAVGMFGGTAGSGLALMTNNTERMRIDSSGNVGINNTSPNTKLDITGSSTNGSGVVDTLRLRNTGATINDGPRLQFTSGTSTSGAAIGSQGKALNSAELLFYAGGNSERMRIDTSGNLLVGKTSAAYNTDGFEARPNGETYVSRSGTPMAINRNSSDGILLNFYKDGSGVGSIGTVDGDIYVGTGDTGLFFSDANNEIRPYNTSTQNSVDAAIDLGRSASRFKDLYLSGGVYLGGTGAANKLDDYEEGTWSVAFTPSTSGTITLTGGAFYTKIGQAVTINISVNSTAVSSPVGYISFNLPFAAASGSQKGRSALALYFDGLASGNNTADFVGLTIDGTSNGRIYIGDSSLNVSDSAQQIDGDSYMLISATYITSA